MSDRVNKKISELKDMFGGVRIPSSTLSQRPCICKAFFCCYIKRKKAIFNEIDIATKSSS